MLAKCQGPSDLKIAKMLSVEDPAMAGQAVAAVAKDLGETKQHFLHGLELELLGHDQALALLAGVLHVVVQGVEILLDFRGPVLGRLSFLSAWYPAGAACRPRGSSCQWLWPSQHRRLPRN